MPGVNGSLNDWSNNEEHSKTTALRGTKWDDEHCCPNINACRGPLITYNYIFLQTLHQSTLRHSENVAEIWTAAQAAQTVRIIRSWGIWTWFRSLCENIKWSIAADFVRDKGWRPWTPTLQVNFLQALTLSCWKSPICDEVLMFAAIDLKCVAHISTVALWPTLKLPALRVHHRHLLIHHRIPSKEMVPKH